MAALLLSGAARAAPAEAGSDLRPWPKGGGHPAVVFFIASHADDPEFGTNTAFHVGDGLFVTCVHGLDGYERFEVLTASGTRARVDRIAAWDRPRDVAVFTVHPPIEGLATLELDGRAAAPGEVATLCGFPGNTWSEIPFPVHGPWTVAGWGDCLLLDGVAAAGSSGSPIVDREGRALGMLFRSAFLLDPGPDCGPATHAVSSREIARVVAEGRAALEASSGFLPIDEWVRTRREDWQGVLDQVHRALSRKGFEVAEEVLRKRMAEHPGEARTLALVARLHRAKGDMEAAAEAVDEALALDRGEFRALFELGKFKEHGGERASAMAAYEQCAGARRPGMTMSDLLLVSDALKLRARLLETAGRWREAVVCYREELRIAPGHACSQRRLGDVLALLDRPRDAIGPYRRALDLRPEHPLTVLRLAIAHSGSGDGKAALETARRASGMHGGSATARYLHGYFAWREGRVDEAREQLEPLRTLDPDLAGRLSAHLEGREERRPTFDYLLDGGLKVRPLAKR
jgi:tetratricopeptide (TPR) repeat protein